MGIPFDAARSREGLAYLVCSGGLGLAALGLGVSTVVGVLSEWSTREAVLAAAQDAPRARERLLELEAGAGSDPAPAILLGSFELERADVEPDKAAAAAALFEKAVLRDPNRTSARVGLAAAELTQAEGGPLAARQRDLEAVVADLDAVPAGDVPDVRYLRGALELLRGDAPRAAELLGDAPEPPLSTEGLGAWYWNRTAADLLTRDGRALEHALQAYQLRRWPIPGELDGEFAPAAARDAVEPRAAPAYLLALAFRVALADPEARPAEPDAVRARCELAERVLALTYTTGNRGLPGRYLPPRPLLPPLYNALGLARFRIGDYAEAAAAFDQAANLTRREEPLYVLNLAEARLRLSQTAVDLNEQLEQLDEAAETYAELVALLAGQEGREGSVARALTNAAALLIQLEGGPLRASNLYRRHGEAVRDEAERARTMGALLDYAGDDRCVDYYAKARDLDHPDYDAIGDRLRELGRRR